MIQKIKMALLSLSWLFVTTVPMTLAGGTAAAATFDPNAQACKGANFQLGSGGNGNCGEAANRLSTFIVNVVNIFSVIVGVVAVIMIIVGGFRYIASGGKQESVQAAKNTILYALIGLVIVALAQLVVKFVISKASSTANS
jgi:hypothetical protein